MARPGVKHSGTSCAVDNTQNKAGLGAGAAPGPDGRPERVPRGLGAVPGSGRGGGTVEGPALQPAASWGFHKYLLNKETTAFAFPVIVALAPPPRGFGLGRPRALAGPPPLPHTGQCPRARRPLGWEPGLGSGEPLGLCKGGPRPLPSHRGPS